MYGGDTVHLADFAVLLSCSTVRVGRKFHPERSWDIVAKSALPHTDELDTVIWDRHSAGAGARNGDLVSMTIVEAHPRVAGLRFQVGMESLGNRISEAEIMTMGCRWKAVNLRTTYNVLTAASHFLAKEGTATIHLNSCEPSGSDMWSVTESLNMAFHAES
jgi:hypothetical protein